jgi:hypothetical protein
VATRIVRPYVSARDAASKKYKDTLARIQAQSAVLALLVPHMPFLPIGAATFILRNQLSPSALPTVAVAWPALVSAAYAQRKERSPEKAPSRELQYWVVVIFWWTVVLFSRQVGLSRVISPDDRSFEAIGLTFALWLRMPWSRDVATDTLYGLSANAVSSLIVNVPKYTPPSGEDAGVLIRMAVRMKFVSEETVDVLKELGRAGLVLFGLIFFLTGGRLTEIGCLVVGHLFPMYNSLIALTSNSPNAQYKWITYWAFCSIFSLFHFSIPVLGWIPFWSHFRLAIYYWLQLPLANGAARLLARLPWIPYFILESWSKADAASPPPEKAAAQVKTAESSPRASVESSPRWSGTSSTGIRAFLFRNYDAPAAGTEEQQRVDRADSSASETGTGVARKRRPFGGAAQTPDADRQQDN